MEIKVKEIIDAYRVLKEVKVNSLSSEAAIGVWKDLKTMRPICKDYDETVEEMRESFNDETFKENQKKANQLSKEGKGSETLDKYFRELNEKFNKFIQDELDKTVDVELEHISEDELIKAVASANLSFDSMNMLEIIIK